MGHDPPSLHLPFEVASQPNDTTCGPTCLYAVYRYFGDRISLEEVIEGVEVLPTGGTLAVELANHALRRGYQATLYTYNLQIFDPTWFTPGVDLADRLRSQREYKPDQRLVLATERYLEYLGRGGHIRLGDNTSSLIRRYLKRGIPILTGLSATYLYRCSREHDDEYDDVRGEPLGHFVVLSGYDRAKREVKVADPLKDNPGFGEQHYSVNMERLSAAIMLGIVTYDANLLVLKPHRENNRKANQQR